MNNLLLNTYDDQRHRGTEGFGLYDGTRNHIVKEKSEKGILNWLVKHNSSVLLFHHRFPTSTINVAQAAHPFTTGDYFGKTEYVLVHNGVIQNSHSLYAEHQKIGIAYQSLLEDGTFNDSEALAWDVARYLEGDVDKLTAYGSIAFVVAELYEGELKKLYFARNYNPLNMYRDNGGLMLSSEGDGEPIKQDTLHTFNYELKRLTKKPLDVPSYDTSVVYEHNYARGTGTTYPRTCSTTWDDEYEDEEREAYPSVFLNNSSRISYKPTIEEINATILGYIQQANGNFEDTYDMMEIDYFSLEATYWSDSFMLSAEIKQYFALQAAMDWLMMDTEWQNERSISSMWFDQSSLETA